MVAVFVLAIGILCCPWFTAKTLALCIECVDFSDGKRLSREPWTTKYADSENENGNHTGDKVYDLQESTYWQTVKGAGFPHLLVIDLGSEQTVTGFEYLPRAEQGAPGSVKNYKIYIK